LNNKRKLEKASPTHEAENVKRGEEKDRRE